MAPQSNNSLHSQPEGFKSVSAGPSTRMTKGASQWISKRAYEIAKQEIKDEDKWQWELIEDATRLRISQDPTTYLVAAILEYLDEL